MKALRNDDVLMTVLAEMKQAGLPSQFVLDVVSLARQDNGIYGLCNLWLNNTAPDDRAEIEADLQSHLEDEVELPKAGGPVYKPKINYDQLDKVVGDIVAFKAKLRQQIDAAGGVVAVAKKIGIPQSSLSRLLNSGSMPRRTTLYKIANALDLTEVDIATEWTT